jgi:hypothetical protein
MTQQDKRDKLLQDINLTGTLEVNAEYILRECFDSMTIGFWCQCNNLLYEINTKPRAEFHCGMTVKFIAKPVLTPSPEEEL